MKEKKASFGQSFMTGTLILSSSIFIVKVLGIFFRFFVTNMIGPTGAAYFSVAYEIYNPLFALSTAGLPIAISRLVSENVAKGRFKDVRQVHKVSIPIFLLTGSVGFVLMLLGAFFVPRLVNVPGAVYSVIALSPTILFACLMSIYRGYHQGLRDVIPTAVSEIIEASCKVVIGSVISYLVIIKGVQEFNTFGTVFGKAYESQEMALNAIMPFASAGAIIGISIGAGVGFLYLLFSHKKRGDGISENDVNLSPKPYNRSYIIKRLIRTAIPIGIGAIIMNIAGFIDTTLILNRIQYVMSKNPDDLLMCYSRVIGPEIINSGDGVHGFLLGCYSFTLPLMMLIPAITSTFGVVSLPAVTRAFTKKNKNELQKSVESVIKMTAIVSVPSGIGIAVLGSSLLSIIYSHRAGAVSIASNIVPILGVATIFMAASTPICSMLQAVGRVDLPVKIITVGLAIKIMVNYLLVGIPTINIQGAGIGTLVGYVFILITSMYFLFKETRVKLKLTKTILKPVFASIICGITAFVSNAFLSKIIPLIISVGLSVVIAIIVYFFSLTLLKSIEEDDIKSLPKGEELAKIFKKLIIYK
ncbi:MAG: Stage V sporulation protein B [Eubacteriales bacterium SKADARSKE-1]|nr:Stage V sporulation protein B [Eubacteriales bacterium SKADARSKE-1]